MTVTKSKSTVSDLVDFSVNNGERCLQQPGGPSMTRQEFADECDINVIMRKYEMTGILPQGDGREARFVDFTSLPSNLMDAMAMFSRAEDSFMLLPASVRKEFDNDPHAFIAFAVDDANVSRMIELGLATAVPAPAAAAAAAETAAPAGGAPAPEPAPAAPKAP